MKSPQITEKMHYSLVVYNKSYIFAAESRLKSAIIGYNTLNISFLILIMTINATGII